MQGLVYADLTRHRLTKTAGGSTFQFPDLVAGDELRLGLRMTESVDGSAVEVDRSVVGLKASLGFVDQRPTAGTWGLDVDGSPVAAIPFGAVAGDLTLAGHTFEDVDGGLILSKDDGSQLVVAAENVDLDPISFVEIREFQQNSAYKYEIRLVQAPIASTSSFLELVPPAPAITSIQVGGTDSSSGAAWNEIQALSLDPTFRGTYQLRRGYRKTSLLSIEDGIDEISDAINASLKDDDDETFVVTNPSNNLAHIEFAGDAGGVAQDLLTVEVFSAPTGDPTFVLDLNTHDLFAALRGANEIKPQLEIELVLEDENGGAEDFTVTVCRQEVKVIDEINKESNTTAQNVDWLRAPDGTTYKPYGAGQIITGSQHYVATFGDASNTSFTFNHNLNTQDVHVTVRDNSTGDILEGAAFDSNITGVNSLDVSTIFTPASNGCAIVITSAGPASAFQAHSHAIAEVDLLQGVLDDLGLRLQVVESLVPTGAISSSISTATSEVAKWKLPEAFEVYPKRGEITGTKVSDIDQSTLPRAGGRLLPAVFDAAPTVVTDLPGSPALNKAYRLATGNLTLPGYRGIRSREIGAFDYFAWDGLGFYQVENVFSADLHEVALADWLTDGTDDAVFSFADEKPQLGENKVGLVKLRGVGLEIPQLVDGWYPYKSDDDGDTMTVIGTTMGADSGTLNTYETAAFTSSNEVVNVTEALIETGGTAMTLEIPGSSVHSDAGARFLFMHVEVNDAGTTGLTTGIHKFYNLGNDSDSWAAVTSGLNDGTLACDLDVTYPKTLQTFEDVDSGEVNRFYPVDFKRELFKVHVNDKQLRLKSKLELDFSLEMAALLADTDVQWGVVVQTGEIITDLLDSGNNGEGREIAGIRWNRPSLDQVVHLTDVVATHNFGLRVYRSSDNEITCSSVEYGQEYGGVQAPSNPNFVVRGLLHRFDVGELNESATGMVAYSGLSVDGEAGGEASITA